MMFFLKLAYTILAIIVVIVYWDQYGPSNFLWFSDIAFFLMVPALWFRNRFISSMMAVGVFPLEILWVIGLLSGGSFLGIAAYMYDPTLPLWLRLLSLFHFPMIMSVIYMIWQYGYDKRALIPQIILSVSVVILTHLFTDKDENVNMVYPPEGSEQFISESFYITLMPFVLVGGVILPMHFVLKRYCPLKNRKTV